MKRCNDCASKVYDSDAVCTACRMLEWNDQQNTARIAQARREAIDMANAEYWAKRKFMRSIIHGIIILVLIAIISIAMIKATDDALEYELVTKPAMLKANGVR